MPHQPSVTLSIADAQDRQSIYALRHQVYARELRQHLENREGLLNAGGSPIAFLVGTTGWSPSIPTVQPAKFY